MLRTAASRRTQCPFEGKVGAVVQDACCAERSPLKSSKAAKPVRGRELFIGPSLSLLRWEECERLAQAR